MNKKNLFVAGLPWAVNDTKLSEIFSQAGIVISAKVITDRDTGKSKGFGFVEMSTEEEAQNAIKNLHGTDLDGRKLVVNVARPREERPR